ncbi:hypothetical protein NWP09_12705, partial [Agrococcus sp. HG114]|nr:hypothetical protein [Agrococcus sp. HG114]
MHDSTPAPATRRSRRTLLWLTTAIASASLALGGAQAASAGQPDAVDHHAVTASPAATSAYWTSARMEAAIDADRLVPGDRHASGRPVEAGEPAARGGRAPQT